ncbi:MAG: exodeoxyribonuclease V subunit alpha [Halothiobacillaceae bacterium]
MNELMTRLGQWVRLGALRPLDLALTRMIAERASAVSEPLLLATALVSEANGHGHVCLDLQAVLDQPERQLADDQPGEAANGGQQVNPVGRQLAEQLAGWNCLEWVTALLCSDAVEDARDDSPEANRAPRTSGDVQAAPLVLGGTQVRPLLYLRRYWHYERQIQNGIEARLKAARTLPPERVRPLLDRLFTENAPTSPNDQKIACALAARADFAIITGGPGTGKTTTVLRLLALLQGLQAQAGERSLTIRLAAPTGKAAARLTESLSGSIEKLPELPGLAIREAIPTEVITLHRLLERRGGSRKFRHHAGHPLPADLVVVDEASMVDVEMLANLLDALKPQARLILLGDRDQLASVEAGSVLGDLCRQAQAGHYTPQTRDWLLAATGETLPQALLDPRGGTLAQATTLLRHSYRFAHYPGIGALARTVNADQPSLAQLKSIFAQYARQEGAPVTPEHNLQLIRLPSRNGEDPAALEPLRRLLRAGYRGYLEQMWRLQPEPDAPREALDRWAAAVFDMHRQFQLLTAVRRGPWGVEALNELVTRTLRDLLPDSGSIWYAGRPVLITRNDYNLGLMNGDIGLCLPWPAPATDPGRRVLRVAFADGQGGIRWVLPSRLLDVETVFAMTVHKSQGSEFSHTALVLPDRHNPVMTRELLYTGITRSSAAFTLIYSQEEALQATLTSRITRASGLRLP